MATQPKRNATHSGARAAAWCVAFGTLLLTACNPSPVPAGASRDAEGWREFQGTWTAAGHRHSFSLGTDRRASVADLEGSLLLSGDARPSVGFRAEAVVLNDSATGMVGRAVWTDDRGDRCSAS